MLRSLTASQFNEWRAFYELDPFGEERDDVRFAAITHALWNIARDQSKHPKGWPLTEFVLAFGDNPVVTREPVKQSVETMTLLLESWIGGSNAVFEKESKSGRRA